MKKSVKVICIIAAVCIALGVCIALSTSVKIGFDFEKLNTETLESKTYTVDEEFQNIDVQTNALNVYFITAEDAQCKVVCTQTKRNMCEISVENDTLTVTQTDTRLWYEHFGIFWNVSDEAEMKITVYLPQQTYRALRVRSQSGNISVSSQFTFDTAEMETASGDIQFAGSVKETLTANSNSGALDLNNLTVRDITAKTASGNITLDSVKTENALRLESNSGIVQLVQTGADMLFCETASGDIQFQDSDADTLKLHSNSGCVNGSLLSSKKFEISTNSGSVDVPPSDNNGGLCAVTTTSGDVTFRISEP